MRLLARGRFDVTLNCLPGIVTVSLWTPLNSALYHLSEALYRRRAEAVALDRAPPVFVLGHWRTGTTLLHDLLAADPAFAAPTTYECLFPGHFLLTEDVLAPALTVFLPRKRPQDDVPVGADRPQEEEFAYANMGLGTPYNTMAWPRHGPADTDYLDLEGLTPAEREEWRRGFLWLYRRLALKHDRPLVLKSPAHTARLKLLTVLFPHARFIHIARNPLAVVPSTVRLWRALYATQGLHNPPLVDDWLEAHVLDTFARLAARYEETRGLIGDGRLAEIRYEDLAAHPKAVLRDLYARLHLGRFEAAEPFFDDYLAARGDHRVARYDDVPAPLRQAIAARLGPYIDRFGYRDAFAE